MGGSLRHWCWGIDVVAALATDKVGPPFSFGPYLAPYHLARKRKK